MNIIPFPNTAESHDNTATDTTRARLNGKISRYPLPCKRQPPSPEWVIATLTNKIYSDRNRKKNWL